MKDYLEALVRDRSPVQGRNLVREYLQARILQAMQRTCAMSSLAFQGGTCLRFLYALPRYSEDLDFALEQDRERYDLASYLQAVQEVLVAEQYRVELRFREHRTVHSGLVRFPGLLHEVGLSPHASEVLAVKIGVDTNPPDGADTDVSLARRHVLLRLRHHDQATLLAGKLHAVLQRGYTKGRDLYDLIWYLSDPDWPAPNLDLLNAALRQSGWQQGMVSAENLASGRAATLGHDGLATSRIGCRQVSRERGRHRPSHQRQRDAIVEVAGRARWLPTYGLSPKLLGVGRPQPASRLICRTRGP